MSSRHNEHDRRFAAEARRQLGTCGVSPVEVEVQYEDVLQDYEVTIVTPASALREDQFVSIARISQENGWWPVFKDEAAGVRFSAARDLIEREASQRRLADRGLLNKIPLFRPEKQDLASYARELEALCGIEPGTALMALGSSLLTIRPLRHDLLAVGQLSCLIDVVNASNLGEYGAFLGIIGNEAAAPDD